MNHRPFLAMMLLSAAALTVHAQIPDGVAVDVSPGIVPPGVPGANVAAKPAEDDEDAAAMASAVAAIPGGARGNSPLLVLSFLHAHANRPVVPPTPRQTLLGQLQFDRRPPTKRRYRRIAITMIATAHFTFLATHTDWT